jgi:hypothetical protein
MRWKRRIAAGLALILGGTAAVRGQSPVLKPATVTRPTIVQTQTVQPTPPANETPGPVGTPGPVQGDLPGVSGDGMGATIGGNPTWTHGALLAQEEGEAQEHALGPTPVKEVRFLMDAVGLNKCLGDSGIIFYGWFDSGYTYASGGPGPLNVQPRLNRFGNEYLFNQIALCMEKPLDPHELSWGFNVQAYGGADPAILNPTAGALITNPDPRFGFDFTDLNLTFHLPILTDGGVDVKVGRQTSIVGSQAGQAPWRVFYSSDYQWFYAEDQRFTGILTTWHVNRQLDISNGVEMGWGTFFDNLSVGPTYIGQINYWTTEEKTTLLTGSVLTGPETQVNKTGANTTMVEGRITQRWNRNFYQILQTHVGYSRDGLAGLGLERFYGVYLYNVYHINACWDFNTRIEWYDDVDGHGYPGGTGIKNNYEEYTIGVDYHPVTYLQIRPEIRYDAANNNPAFGNADSGHLNKNQVTLAVDCLIKF